jgi:hypothetical protein
LATSSRRQAPEETRNNLNPSAQACPGWIDRTSRQQRLDRDAKGHRCVHSARQILYAAQCGAGPRAAHPVAALGRPSFANGHIPPHSTFALIFGQWARPMVRFLKQRRFDSPFPFPFLFHFISFFLKCELITFKFGFSNFRFFHISNLFKFRIIFSFIFLKKSEQIMIFM